MVNKKKGERKCKRKITCKQFLNFTGDLYREYFNMEKEHSTKSQSAPTNNHIVTSPAV